MYGQDAVVPVGNTVPSLRIVVDKRLGDEESLHARLMNLTKLDERRMRAQWAMEVTQRRQKYWHNKHLRQTNFLPEQLVLKYNGGNKCPLRKVKVRWSGPYKIREVGNNGAVKHSTLDDHRICDLVNGSKLKLYRECDKLVLSINMLGYATKGDWTIVRNKKVDKDLVVAVEPYKHYEDWAKPLTFMEE